MHPYDAARQGKSVDCRVIDDKKAELLIPVLGVRAEILTRKGLRMTKQEVRDETKQTEGQGAPRTDPHRRPAPAIAVHKMTEGFGNTDV
jgi:hypothetical protein